MMCQKCGKEEEMGNRFCTSCGTSLEAKRKDTPVPPKKKNKTKRDVFIIVGILFLVILLVLFLCKNGIFKKQKTHDYSNTSSDTIISTVKDNNGITKFIDGPFTEQLVKNEEDAYQALATLKRELQFQNALEEFEITNVDTSENITYYKFKQKYKDTDIYNTNLVISVDKNGSVLSMSGYYIPNIHIDTQPKKKQKEMEDLVKIDLGENAAIVSSSKEIYADGKNQTLVYVITGYSDTKAKEYLIDAN